MGPGSGNRPGRFPVPWGPSKSRGKSKRAFTPVALPGCQAKATAQANVKTKAKAKQHHILA
eukprot:5375770-Pyramimonas_sp.AAC.1